MKKRLGYAGNLEAPGPDLRVVPGQGLVVDRRWSGWSVATSRPMRHAERLFAALDGSEIQTACHRFNLQVFSVTDQVTGRWVQLGLRGAEQHLVTLRLPRRSGLREATTALSRWLADPTHLGEIVELT